MTTSNLRVVLMATACGVFMTSCGGGGGSAPPPPPPPPPPVNGLPNITTTLSVEVDENDSYVFQLGATDPDGDSLTWRLNSSEDSGLFTINSSTGLIETVPPNYIFDHENPGDANGDNDYILEVSVTDGKDRVTEGLTIRVLDLYEPPFCRTTGTLTVDENISGLLDTFSTEVPEQDENFVEFRDLQISTIANNTDIFTLDPASGELRATDPIDFEVFGDSVEITATAAFTMSQAQCQLTLQIVDDPGRVVSGARLEGFSHLEAKGLGDIDGNGTGDLYLRVNDVVRAGDPASSPFALFVRGEAVDGLVAPTGDGIFDLGGAGVVELRADFGPDVSQYYLYAAEPADVDGNGRADLVLSFNNGIGTVATGVPLGFVVWGETFDDTSLEVLDLASLTAGQGLVIEAGTAASDTRSTRTVAGDFTGDGNVDLAVSLPWGDDPADPTSVQGNVYIATQDAIASALGGGTLDVSAVDGGDGVRLTGERNLGVGLLSVSSLDGDAALELAIKGERDVFVIDGQAIADLVATGTSGMAIPAQDAGTTTGVATIGDGFGGLPGETADIDGDGIADIAVSTENDFQLVGSVAFGDDIAAGGFVDFDDRADLVFLDRTFSNPKVLPIGDLDGDGLAEVIAIVNAQPPADPAGFEVATISVVSGATLAAQAPGDPAYDVSQPAIAGQHVGILGLNEAYAIENPLARVDDLDGDGLPELYLARRTLDRGLVVRGADLRDALIAGTDIELDDLLNVEG